MATPQPMTFLEHGLAKRTHLLNKAHWRAILKTLGADTAGQKADLRQRALRFVFPYLTDDEITSHIASSEERGAPKPSATTKVGEALAAMRLLGEAWNAMQGDMAPMTKDFPDIERAVSRGKGTAAAPSRPSATSRKPCRPRSGSEYRTAARAPACHAPSAPPRPRAYARA